MKRFSKFPHPSASRLASVDCRLLMVLLLLHLVCGSRGLIHAQTASVPGSAPLHSAAPVAAATPAPATRTSRKTPLAQSPAREQKARGRTLNDAARQGIPLYGRWVIDVKNPDGTLAQHRAFENGIVDTGDKFLIYLMAGWVAPSNPTVYIGVDPGSYAGNGLKTPPCSNPVTAGSGTGFLACPIPAVSAVNPGTGATINGGATMDLTAQQTVTADGFISAVGTAFGGCHVGPGNTEPAGVTNLDASTCQQQLTNVNTYEIDPFSFTYAGLGADALLISKGQIVQISVSFSFVAPSQ